MKITVLTTLALICGAFCEEVRLLDLEPTDAQQYIDKQDTSLKYAPKIDSNVPAVRFLGNEPHNVLEDIYLANQYHGQDGLGGYLYGYSVPDIAKTERKKAGGDLRGAYNYIAGDGQEIKVEYWDDGTGFHQVDNVDKILPKQVDDTPEVKAAKDEFFRIWQEQAERNSKPIADPNAQYRPGQQQYPHTQQQQQYSQSQPQQLVNQYQQQKQQFPNPGQSVHYQADQAGQYQAQQSQNLNKYQAQGQIPAQPQPQAQISSQSQGFGQGQGQGFNQARGQTQGYNQAQGQHSQPQTQSYGQPQAQASAQYQNKAAYGQFQQTSGQYQSQGQDGQYQSGSEKQYNGEDEGEKGPPKGFFYSFDYPVGIIVSKQGGAVQKRESDLKDIYATNKANFEQQLQSGSSRSARSSTGYLVIKP